MSIRVVVADERRADFFDAYRPSAPLGDCGSISNPSAGLKDRDLETDRAGRRYGGTSGVMRAGSAHGHHHGVAGERSTERHELTLFAKDVARRIEAGRVNHEFEKLVLIAPPRMMGLLRQSLSSSAEATLVSEISKDLIHQGPDAIRRAVPVEVFTDFPA